MREETTIKGKAATICLDADEVLAIKNQQYGNSIEWTGVLGAVVEIVAKTARLLTLVLRSPEHGRQDASAVRDSLLDLHNYAVIGLLMLEQNNWEGRLPEAPKEDQDGRH